ncbi:hypothetical protein [Haladaptatus sp. DFWS20]|uniref:hypothetical protein n=1 Tax=Haladaptatus sp. DFWS20 TaxID=3403467 RepID=UPI003EC012D5
MRINIGEDTYEPWVDGIGSSSVIKHDINDPTNGEYYRFTENVSAGEAISVEGTAYAPESVSWWTSVEKRLNHNGDGHDYVWTSYRTSKEGSMQANIEVDTDGKGQSEANVVLLADEMEVPNYGSTNVEQRNMSQTLGDRINDTGHLDLNSNEFVLVYELSCEDATTDDTGNPNKWGSTDPDYNDAVVLVSIHEYGSVTAPEDFRIYVTMNQVEITKKNA